MKELNHRVAEWINGKKTQLYAAYFSCKDRLRLKAKG